MRNILLIILPVLILSCNGRISNEPKKLDIVSYDINIHLDTLNKRLNIKTEIQIEKPDSIDVISLLFVDFAKIDEIELGKMINNEFTRRNDTISIKLNNQNKLDLSINYTLPIDSFGNNQILTLTRPMKWCPFAYDDISLLETNITLPANYRAYTSGHLEIEKTDNETITYSSNNEHNAGFPVVIADSSYYRETEKELIGMKVKFCFHNSDSVLTGSIIDECIKTLKFCSEYIGSYNRESLTFIEIPNAFYCQSLETFLMAGDGFVAYYPYPQMKFWVSHETIHQWIGSGFFTPIKNENKLTWFITESLTEYLRFQYIEKQYGADSLKQQIEQAVNEYETTILGTEYDLPIIANQPNRATYLIGPLIFHNIRLQIGDKKWQDFIRKLYSENFGNILTYDNFNKTLSLYASDSLMNKMEYWVSSKGISKELVSP